MYRAIDVGEVVATVERLRRRIEDRFPGSGLASVCAELVTIGHETRARSRWIARPQVVLRVAVAALMLVPLAALAWSIASLDLAWSRLTLPDLVQVTEAAVNELVLLGAGALFLVTVETRVKRVRALAALHELRSIAHVIDMHQLTKDPGMPTGAGLETDASPVRTLTAFELSRYLDYCSEMLSLVGKLAALYAQEMRDATLLGAVNEVEDLTTGLSGKIWQKIDMLDRAGP